MAERWENERSEWQSSARGSVLFGQVRVDGDHDAVSGPAYL